MSHSRTGGFTSIEMVFVLTFTLIVTVGLTRLLESSRAIERHARTDVLMERDLRAGLLSIADVLRNVPEIELGGFDEDEHSARPTFQRIASSEDGAAVLGGSAYLEWRATEGGRSDDPGGIYLVEEGVATLITSKITEGSFHVYKDTTSVKIEIETQRATGEGRNIRTRGGEIVVGMRN